MEKRLTIAVFVAFILCNPGNASALINFINPYGPDPVNVYIGQEPHPVFGPRQVLVWEHWHTGECRRAELGDANGLKDDILVQGGGGSDYIQVLDHSEVVCGSDFHLEPLVYGGYYLDIDGRGGRDILVSGDGETWINGAGENDQIVSYNPTGKLWGGSGNDNIWALGFGIDELLFGQDGADCLSDSTASAAAFDCGSGSDFFETAAPVNRVSCESARTPCPSNFR